MRNKNKRFVKSKGENVMTISTFAAGITIIATTILLELLDKDNENKRVEFENSYND